VGDQTALYAELVARTAPDADVDLPRCASLADPDLAGDCQLAIALQSAVAAKLEPEAYCSRISGVPFRNECHFMAAETRVKRGQLAEAVALCKQAGAFDLDCAQHLWQDEVLATVRGHDDRELVAMSVEGAALHDRWAPHLATHTDFERRFWRYWYGAFFERAKNLPIQPCAMLESTHAVRCRYSVAHIYLRRLRDRLGHRHGRAALCNLSPLTTAAAASALPGMTAEDDPLLRAVLVEQQQNLCVDGNRDAVEGGVLGPDAWAAAVAAAAVTPAP
jgi:hypothetical protein